MTREEERVAALRSFAESNGMEFNEQVDQGFMDPGFFVFGLGSLSKVALVFLECLYPMTIITYHGARSVNPIFIWSTDAAITSP